MQIRWKATRFERRFRRKTVGHLLGKQKYLSIYLYIHHQNVSVAGFFELSFLPKNSWKRIDRKGGRFIGQTPFRMQSVSKHNDRKFNFE